MVDRLAEFRLLVKRAKSPLDIIDKIDRELLQQAGFRIYTDMPNSLCAERVTDTDEYHIRVDKRNKRIGGTIRLGGETSTIWRRFKDRFGEEFPRMEGELSVRVRPTEEVTWDVIVKTI